MIETDSTSKIQREFLRTNELRDKSIYYRTGDRFNNTLDGGKYEILGGTNLAALVSIKTGKLYAKPVRVENPFRITENDWRQITAGYGQHFSKI